MSIKLKDLTEEEEAAICLACTLEKCCGGETQYCLLAANPVPVTAKAMPSKTVAERRAYAKAYYEKNRAHLQEYMARYYHENKGGKGK